ncbi:unnamed protein product (macronuclear) [Paramecium tetraurelia]|uniref:Cyclin n=1 Tax=Paramecium tetraurelia TaxID=5888 RepID=A0CXA2_PARTE|nr:uncharacterized protein GSPATT00011051001 [Paramecium tetraurelia]CAK75419.1 unnamed protein product [Paramecium tetraurelia]|eukprot:XP_001442816.1 hypothetical protein (macronuclear) [Paramecium tetraurelia strain d4-2]
MHRHNQILTTIADILDEIIKQTDALEIEQDQISYFHATKAPSISIYNYLQRISKYTNCSEGCIVIALIYLDRLQEKHPYFVLNSKCIHRYPFQFIRFLLISIVIAIKFQDDEYYKNEYYAKVGGVSTKEILVLELEFLELMDHQLFISDHDYLMYEKKLLQYGEIEMP